ncbi:hypothetical protein ACFQY5_08000 [Paeniroseomonas aquatica]|uniref:hypothetical protein n=1 Tax=Paeniroseomonas aquatica TaxID=373043 RepID=UPI0036097BBF
MSDSDTQPGHPRLDAVQCPHCEQVTMPNLLADGSYVCSCTAERALPREGDGSMLAAPMDGPSPPAPQGTDPRGRCRRTTASSAGTWRPRTTARSPRPRTAELT